MPREKTLREKVRNLLTLQAYVTGFQPYTLYASLRRLPTYFRDLRAYEKGNPPPSMKLNASESWPILTDMGAGAGIAGGHYFHQDLWAARKIFRERPAEHLDIGSRTDGFIAHLLVFMPVTVVDIRPLASGIAGLNFFQDDASQLGNIPTDSVHSLSTLHAAEHFGLGRYGDPIDPHGCFKFMSALGRVLAPGGRLYFSVPIGREHVQFNAQRTFAPQTILNHFSGLDLVSFSFVGDDGLLYEDRDPLQMPENEQACGLFEFTKTTP